MTPTHHPRTWDLLLLLLLLCPAHAPGKEREEELEVLLEDVEEPEAMLEDDDEEGGDPLEITWGRPNTNTAYFDDDSPSNVTAIVGLKASLPCGVLNLAKKDQVSWIRQRDLHILTVGVSTYTSDDRFKVRHPAESNQWFLEISSVTFRDAGVYECQVSTSPKISLPVLLAVEVQKARIEGPAEVYIQNGSTIRLTCRVNTHADNVGAVVWFRDAHRLDYDSPRGGVSVEIEKTPSRTTSKLFITPALKADSGNYTCGPEFAEAASVLVHVVNGEESAAVQKARCPAVYSDPRVLGGCVLLLLLLWPHCR
ncbi:kin of IRRE-like protein 1 [Procambarus clarkii]|uniref:kin of IRRE-like protein 1 n=1 Tax=Procambarus clarkii TaxID=6728 RepID=UPI001E6700E7|nr:obscurin-like [Procambarus clarkii]